MASGGGALRRGNSPVVDGDVAGVVVVGTGGKQRACGRS